MSQIQLMIVKQQSENLDLVVRLLFLSFQVVTLSIRFIICWQK